MKMTYLNNIFKLKIFASPDSYNALSTKQNKIISLYHGQVHRVGLNDNSYFSLKFFEV